MPVAPLYGQLRPSKKASPERVAADQRRRLHGAMVAAVARGGYEQASVDEIVGLAGVSTKTLYSLFGSKRDCFLATCDHVVEDSIARVTGAFCRGSALGGPRAGLLAAFERLVDDAITRPASSRIAFTELLTLGTDLRARIQWGESVSEGVLTRGVRHAGGGEPIPPMLAKAMVHGVWSVMRRALLERRERGLHGVEREMMDWVLALSAGNLSRLALVAAAPAASAMRPSRRGARGRDGREQAIAACAALAARRGYGALSIARIARESRLSEASVAGMFENVEDCFGVAVETLGAQSLARALRASRDADSWAQSVCFALDSIYAEVASDPVFAQICFVEIFATGEAGAQRRGALIAGFARSLANRMPRGRTLSPLAAQLIAGAVWGLAHHHVLQRRTEQLPAAVGYAAYVVIAPTLGCGEALDAVERWRATSCAASASAYGGAQPEQRDRLAAAP
ncbi:MAG: TetR/AcrR family transcriptional regulator [Solirubrobacteraceae bacterium]